MSERCYEYKGVHIPGCMGCAVRGHAYCTCPPVHSERGIMDHIGGIRRESKFLRRRIDHLLKVLDRVEAMTPAPPAPSAPAGEVR